jgi:hypothetical protein
VNRTDFVFTHASLDTFLTDKANESDVELLVDGLVHGSPRDWIILTETGQKVTVDLVERVAGRRYQTINPDAGDITFLVARGIDVLDAGGPVVIPPVRKPAKDGGHGPRCNSYVKMSVRGEIVTHVGLHLVTFDADHDPGGPNRGDDQRHQLEVAARMMDNFGRGRMLATGSGDLNGVLPLRGDLQAIFDRHEITTTAHETGVHTPTHGRRRIDYAWTRDQDGRLVVDGMKVRRGAQWSSDHDPIDVWAHAKGKA